MRVRQRSTVAGPSPILTAFPITLKPDSFVTRFYHRPAAESSYTRPAMTPLTGSALLDRTAARVTPLDAAWLQRADDRLNRLTKPAGSLGQLEALARQLVAITENPAPGCANKVIFCFAADHGVTAEGVSAYPPEVTPQMVLNFLAGGAAINVLARVAGARVVVADLGVAADLPAHPGLVSAKVAKGTANFARLPAMAPDEARTAVEHGIRIANDEMDAGAQVLATGDMGIGNTTAASAITAAMTGAEPANVTGYGTGISEDARTRKAEVIARALLLHEPDPAKPLDVLAKVGGFEIGGLAGVMLAGAARRVPVVVDGFISGAAALVACGLAPALREHLIAAHRSAERGHARLLDHLGLAPLLSLGLRLGEGTGAALALPLVDAACRILTEMATFDSAGVSEKSG